MLLYACLVPLSLLPFFPSFPPSLHVLHLLKWAQCGITVKISARSSGYLASTSSFTCFGSGPCYLCKPHTLPRLFNQPVIAFTLPSSWKDQKHSGRHMTHGKLSRFSRFHRCTPEAGRVSKERQYDLCSQGSLSFTHPPTQTRTPVHDVKWEIWEGLEMGDRESRWHGSNLGLGNP